MSIVARDWAWGVHGLTMGTKVVLLCLAEHADDEGHAWPSYTQMATECSCNRDTITESIKALRSAGLLTAERRAGYRGTTHYWLTLSATTTSPLDGMPVQTELPSRRNYTPPLDGFSGPLDGNTGTTRRIYQTETVIEPSIEPSVEPSVRRKRPRKTEGRQHWGGYADKEAFLAATIPKFAAVLDEQRVRDETDLCLGYRTTGGHTRLDLTVFKWLRAEAQREQERKDRSNGYRPQARTLQRHGKPSGYPTTPGHLPGSRGGTLAATATDALGYDLPG